MILIVLHVSYHSASQANDASLKDKHKCVIKQLHLFYFISIQCCYNLWRVCMGIERQYQLTEHKCAIVEVQFRANELKLLRS